MEEYLKTLREKCPEWLENYQKGQPVDLTDILQCRYLYYAGSGIDGQPVKTFNQFHVVHTFMYVDYGISKKGLDAEIAQKGFKGYHVLDKVEFSENDFHLKTLNVNLEPQDIEKIKHGYRPFISEKPYCVMYIFERDEEYDDSYGSHRFAVIFLYADAIATYGILFCANKLPKPFIFVLQDHGFGGNYDWFGADGILCRIAQEYQCFPEYMLVAENTKPWPDYRKLSEQYVVGGWHHIHRFLYRKLEKE